ncbi:MAG: hypothetical protein SCALA701_26640 [Candidatus Scalindua sp.]|nr:MAG: hypothetical protein DWQ00_04980 [Candidatus Scalindua sp.]NOG83535.1 hypothetical protein [Planctomycetota bacterium]RZV72061.1 MAG: hypothetical protein EX341_14335 [Candidatus Scalindua sp. SCAELEC01]GJQ59863.1 MAG: hypothetical protein SCALA701_26640 [Candidatus Scalindua sp.]
MGIFSPIATFPGEKTAIETDQTYKSKGKTICYAKVLVTSFIIYYRVSMCHLDIGEILTYNQ